MFLPKVRREHESKQREVKPARWGKGKAENTDMFSEKRSDRGQKSDLINIRISPAGGLFNKVRVGEAKKGSIKAVNAAK